MWKILGLLLIVWELLADWLEPVIRSRFGKLGLSLYGIVLLYSRIRERAQSRILEARVAALEEGHQWDAEKRYSKKSTAKTTYSASPGLTFHVRFMALFTRLVGTGRFGLRRRRRRVEELKRNWITIGPSLLGGVKLILEPFGVTIPQDDINNIINGVAAALTVFGIVYHHLKKPKGGTVSGSSQSTNTIGNTK